MVNLDCIKGFNAVNRMNGFAEIEIRSPQEIVAL